MAITRTYKLDRRPGAYYSPQLGSVCFSGLINMFTDLGDRYRLPLTLWLVISTEPMEDDVEMFFTGYSLWHRNPFYRDSWIDTSVDQDEHLTKIFGKEVTLYFQLWEFDE